MNNQPKQDKNRRKKEKQNSQKSNHFQREKRKEEEPSKKMEKAKYITLEKPINGEGAEKKIQKAKYIPFEKPIERGYFQEQEEMQDYLEFAQILDEEQEEEQNTHKQFEILILQHNPFTSKKYCPQTAPNIDLTFQNMQRYQNMMIELLKAQLVSSIQQKIQKRQFSQCFQGQYCFQNDGNIAFTPQIKSKSSKKKLKDQKNLFDMLLMKGKRLGLASKTLNLSDQDLKGGNGRSIGVQLCFLKKKSNKNTVTFLTNDPKVISKYNYFFDLETLATHLRQIDAVKNINKFKMSDQILNPEKISYKYSKNRSTFMRESKAFVKILKQRNKSQINTIYKIGSCNDGIHFIQGPPGTGKTSTILSLVSMELKMIQQKINLKIPQKNIIMICSQSNAAIDDVCSRLAQKKLLKNKNHEKQQGKFSKTTKKFIQKDQTKTEDKQLEEFEQLKIIRIGAVKQGNKHLIKYNLMHICQKRIHPNQQSSLELEIEKQKIEKDLESGDYEDKQLLKQKLNDVIKKIVEWGKYVKNNMKRLMKLQEDQLKTADVILSTLSSSSLHIVKQCLNEKVRCLLIDEAGQATEPSLLIPLQLNPQKVVLIGDPQQLAPTVLSERQGGAALSQSFFQRCKLLNIKFHFLDTQYRMNPILSQYPNQKFYRGRLKNGETKNAPLSLVPFLKEGKVIFFFDICTQMQMKKKTSFINIIEGQLVAQVINTFIKKDKDLSIGVITPYKKQAQYINSCIKQIVHDDMLLNNVKVSTVDAFQGQERNIIIFSTVRSNLEGEVGFLRDERRLNVSLTRAQNILIAFGNAETLKKDQLLGSFVHYVSKKGVLRKISQKNEANNVLKDNLWSVWDETNEQNI